EKEVMKRPRFDFQQKSSKKRSREDSDENNAKKHKLKDDAEKKELRDSMDVVPIDDIAIDVESLATKYPIVDWKTHVLTENMMYYQIIKADESFKNYKIFSEMLDDFDRQDVLDLHRLVQEMYDTTSPKGYDLLLWGDLKILFEPNEDDEIWKNQQDYNLISWRLFDSCGIHMLLMHTGIAIHMMIEKKYPLTQEMLSRMLSRRLGVDQESEMAFELLRLTVVRSMEVPIIALIVKPGTSLSMSLLLDTNSILEELLRNLKPNPPVEEPEGSDDYTEAPFDDEQILRQHYIAHVMPPPLAYTPPPHFLTTMEPTDTLLMGDEVISTILTREINEFIKSSVDDLLPIPRESEVTSDSNLECDMPINTPLPTIDVREENFDINSPLGEYVVDFLMENVDVADLPRHLNNLLFDEEFEDISSLNPPKSAPLNYEPLGNPDSVSRSLETSDLNLEELDT
ncbi:hypothetical protein Tco_1224452, partial [Tanacetum coccineum]